MEKERIILVTGLEAFGKTPINPAEQVARALNGMVINGHRIVAIIVPNTFFKSIEVVIEAIQKYNPEMVTMLGEYGGRSGISVERISQNFNDSARYGLKDNKGKMLQGEPTALGGPVAYYSTLPIRAMVKAMREAGIPADISDTPGTNVCNHLMYGILHFIASKTLPIRAGWIHLPFLPSTAALEENLGAPSMSKETAVQGVTAAVKTAIEHPTDIRDTILSRWQV
jgi:pyroglutamyl-peptidase